LPKKEPEGYSRLDERAHSRHRAIERDTQPVVDLRDAASRPRR
jgi:hypothetical protein